MRYEPVILGLKGQIRLQQLTGRHVLVVVCPECHTKYNVAPHYLFTRYHELSRLEAIQIDMRCKRRGCDYNLAWYIMEAVGPVFPRSA